MELKNKLNFIQYIIGTFSILGVIYYFSSPSVQDFRYQTIVLACAMLNQIMLLKGVLVILDPEPVKWRGAWAMLYIFGKTIILGTGFYLIIKYAPHKTLNSVFIYIFQLINLALSIKKSSV
jgi:hypothetical protein